MTRRHHYHDFPSATGDPVYRVSFDCHSAAERDAVRAAGLAVVVPAAFVPALSSGPAFDSPEVIPPSADPVVVLGPGAATYNPPPNCDGNAQFGQEPTQAGYALAHAQHEAATDGDDCTSGACLITRGSD